MEKMNGDFTSGTQLLLSIEAEWNHQHSTCAFNTHTHTEICKGVITLFTTVGLLVICIFIFYLLLCI